MQSLSWKFRLKSFRPIGNRLAYSFKFGSNVKTLNFLFFVSEPIKHFFDFYNRKPTGKNFFCNEFVIFVAVCRDKIYSKLQFFVVFTIFSSNFMNFCQPCRSVRIVGRVRHFVLMSF